MLRVSVRLLGALAIVLASPLTALAVPTNHPTYLATMNPSVLPPNQSLLPCQTCHVTTGGGGTCTPGFGACFNPFGYQYWSNSSGWAGISGSNADGDNRTNTQELTDGTFPGFPNGAESVGCDMGICATTGTHACGDNITCTGTQIVFNGGLDTRYTFGFACDVNGTSPEPATSDGDWTDRCDDQNECSPNPCGVGSCSQIAVGPSWSSPGYTCSCPTGYASNGSTCVVTNDCLAGTDDCIGIATCSDDPGAGNFTCTCPHAGYQGNGRSSGTGCTNIDECAADPCGPFDDSSGPSANGCTERALGTWTSPGYDCSCAVGYMTNGTTCALADECTAGLDDCDTNAVCMDPTSAAGDFTCTCNPGFVGDGSTSGTGCTDLNECMLGTDNCSTNATCTNTPGSFSCACNSGFSGDGVTCTDIDECMDPIFVAMCDGNASCNNLTGTFECNCNAGYSGSGFVCTDDDECALGTDNCSADGTCTNTGGSFTCACNSGFTGDGVTCTDIDECMDTTITSTCSSVSTCVNSPGSWECVCDAGFDGDGITCTDVDECMTGAAGCDSNAACLNEPGSFSCMCNEGYRGSGFDCVDIDECADGTDGCGPNELCVNNEGAANSCTCRVGFARDGMGVCRTTCGDASVTVGEACDDGNADAGDGCSELCEVEPGYACYEPTGGASECEMTCGDGLIDAAEECDDADANSDTEPDACRADCTRPACGDGVQDSSEECDLGDANDDATDDGCRTTCHEAYCGDGIVDSGEMCDPGGGVPGSVVAGTCTTLCAPDAGVDPTDPPELTGGGCRATPGPSEAPWLVLLALGLLWRRRRG